MYNVCYRGSKSDYLMENGLPESVYSLLEHTKSDITVFVCVLDGGNERINSFFRNLLINSQIYSLKFFVQIYQVLKILIFP